jgi:hypothetical protein
MEPQSFILGNAENVFIAIYLYPVPDYLQSRPDEREEEVAEGGVIGGRLNFS